MKGTLEIQSWYTESHGYRLKLRCTACGHDSEVVVLGNERARTDSVAGLECRNCRGFGTGYYRSGKSGTAAPDASTVTREEVELLAKHLAAGIRVNTRQSDETKALKEQVRNLERQNRQLFAAQTEHNYEQRADREDERRNGPVTRARAEQARRLTLALEHNAELREKLQAANRKLEPLHERLVQQSTELSLMEQRFREKDATIEQLRADIQTLRNTITLLKSME